MNTFNFTPQKNNPNLLYRLMLVTIIFQLAFAPTLGYCAEETPLAPFTSARISTLAGTGQKGFTDGVLATKAQLAFPSGLALDSKSNIFIADSLNNRVRKIDANSGIITTIAGNGESGFSGDGGHATKAKLSLPVAVSVDKQDNLFIVDAENNVVRRVDATSGIITSVAGNGTADFAGDGGLAINASLDFGDEVGDVDVDLQGNIFIADSFNDRVRRVDAQTGIITTIAGNGEGDFSGDNGPAKQASLLIPSSVLLDGKGGLLISDSLNDRVRKIDLNTNIITTVAGNGDTGFDGDNKPALNTSLSFPRELALDKEGNLFITDTDNLRIRRVDTQTGIVTTVAGNGEFSTGIDNKKGIKPEKLKLKINKLTPSKFNSNKKFFVNGDGSDSTGVPLDFPEAVAITSLGNLLIADTEKHAIRLVIPSVNNPDANFNLTINPSSQTIQVGSSTSFTIGLQTSNGFSSPVNLSASTNPPNASISTNFSSNRITSGNTVTLTVNTTSNAMTSTLNIDVGGISGQLIRSQTVTLAIMGQSRPTISGVNFAKPTLTINGSGFGITGAKVSINGQDISNFIISQTNTQIALKGNKKKLKLVKGANQIIVTINGLASNAFVFNFFKGYSFHASNPKFSGERSPASDNEPMHLLSLQKLIYLCLHPGIDLAKTQCKNLTLIKNLLQTIPKFHPLQFL